ncbi:MAG: hypothetical protein ACOH17_03495 [Cellulomonas sp.]
MPNGSDVLQSLFVVLLVIGIPLGLVGAWWFQRKRTEQLTAWAATIGWRFEGSDPTLTTRWTGQPFGQGHSRKATDVLRGRFEGMPATSFTYRWTTGSGKEESTYVRHVIALDLPAFLPNVELTPDGFGAKLAKAVGGQDIQFESDDFNRAWRVTSRDLAVAHAIVNPLLMERLLRADATGECLRIEGTSILSWATGRTSTDTLARRLGVLAAVVRAIPRHVWMDHGYDPMTDQTTRGTS